MKNVFELLEEYGSPLYVYNHQILKLRCSDMRNFCISIRQGLADKVKVSAHYSTKSNSNPAILKVVEKSGLNVDCMSPFELRMDELSGFTPDRMLYVCNNISAEEMKLVHEKGILICLDSISQVETWGKQFPGTDIMIRINPGVTGVGHSQKVITSGKATKFGICEDNLPELKKVAEKYDLNIIGTHQHLGSLFLNDKISYYIAGVKAGLEIVKKYFPDVQIIDLGGGFGVPYKPEEKFLNMEKLEVELILVLKEFISCCPSVKEFKFEPGRFIPCEAGRIIGTVNAVKYENETWWIGTDIGMNQLVRPSMYGSYHEIEVIPKGGKSISKEKFCVNFCGNICESGDILGKERLLDSIPVEGDVVVVRNAGAYGYSMASNYTGRPRPAEIMAKDNEYILIRKAETVEDMMMNIVF